MFSLGASSHVPCLLSACSSVSCSVFQDEQADLCHVSALT